MAEAPGLDAATFRELARLAPALPDLLSFQVAS
jgi:hypothetical protein